MDILVHIGLNKCASTQIQHALDAARSKLAAVGTFYPDQKGPPCQYGLSKSLGFGPDNVEIVEQPIEQLIAAARNAGCGRMILSSEYLSLWNPGGVARFVARSQRLGARLHVLVISRDPIAWIHSQFNQYIRTVRGGGLFPSIDAYIDQVLAKGSFRIDRRIAQWQEIAGNDAMAHHRLEDTDRRILAPFSAFAGAEIKLPRSAARNSSLDADRLFRVAVLRQPPPTPAVESEISAILSGAPAPDPAPDGYLTISDAQMTRLEKQVVGPYRAVPVTPWPVLDRPFESVADQETV